MSKENTEEIERIVKEVKKGNQESFNDFFFKFKNYVYFIAGQYISSPQERDDLVQNAFILIFKNIKDLRNMDKILSWMKRIIATAYKEMRVSNERLKRKAEIHNEDITDIEDLYDEEMPLPDDIAIQHDEKVELMSAIKKLSEKQRRIVLLYYFQGFTTREISNMEGVSEGSIKNSLIRAKDSLRKKIPVEYAPGLGSVIALTYGQELKNFKVPNVAAEEMWSKLTVSIKKIALISALKPTFIALGLSLVGISLVTMGGIFNYNNNA